MTKAELERTVHLCTRDFKEFNLIMSAVEAYCSASNNGKPHVSGSLPSDEDVRLKCYMSRDKSLENTYVAGFMKGAKYMRKEIESKNGMLGNGA